MNKSKKLKQCLEEINSMKIYQIYSTPFPESHNERVLLFKGTPKELKSILSDYWLNLFCDVENDTNILLLYYMIYN